MLKSIDPTHNELVAEYEVMNEAAVDAVLAGVHTRGREWRALPIDERVAPLRALAQLLRDRTDALARRMTLEMGKTVTAARAEVEKCAWLCDHYHERAAEYLAPEPIDSDAAQSYVAYRPLGVVLGVMPWNYPLWQAFRFIVPTLAAGNVAVLKHASNVTGCALAIEDLVLAAGFPPGTFRSLRIGGDRVGEVIDDERVAAVTLTGSEPAGRAVAERAGRALKPSLLELGGSDPYLVLADADLELAADALVESRLLNAGQSCIAAKRFIVHRDVHDEFVERVVARMQAAVVGDPSEEATDLGPMARVDLRDELHDQVERSVHAGARVECGGQVPDRRGAWYPPTVLTGVVPGMPAHDEELFGPVASVVRADDEADAIRLANATSFGLGAAVFTADVERGERIARDQLEAGCCFVNDFVRSDPRLPFGGIKNSGYGRELGRPGIRAFVNVKTVYLARGGGRS